MSLLSPTWSAPGTGFPRVSGDEPPRVRVVVPLASFSPRERG